MDHLSSCWCFDCNWHHCVDFNLSREKTGCQSKTRNRTSLFFQSDVEKHYFDRFCCPFVFKTMFFVHERILCILGEFLFLLVFSSQGQIIIFYSLSVDNKWILSHKFLQRFGNLSFHISRSLIVEGLHSNEIGSEAQNFGFFSSFLFNFSFFSRLFGVCKKLQPLVWKNVHFLELDKICKNFGLSTLYKLVEYIGPQNIYSLSSRDSCSYFFFLFSCFGNYL